MAGSKWYREPLRQAREVARGKDVRITLTRAWSMSSRLRWRRSFSALESISSTVSTSTMPTSRASKRTYYVAKDTFAMNLISISCTASARRGVTRIVLATAGLCDPYASLRTGPAAAKALSISVT